MLTMGASASKRRGRPLNIGIRGLLSLKTNERPVHPKFVTRDQHRRRVGNAGVWKSGRLTAGTVDEIQDDPFEMKQSVGCFDRHVATLFSRPRLLSRDGCTNTGTCCCPDAPLHPDLD